MTRKLARFRREYKEFSACILKSGWYWESTEGVLDKLHNEATRWDDTLDFMDTLIDCFEANPITDELIIIQAGFALPDAFCLETEPPEPEQAKKLARGGSVCAFPFRIATILNRWPYYQKPIWHRRPRYHSMKLFTYYRCTDIPVDDAHPRPDAGPYRCEIVRFWSQKWTQGDGPGFLLP